MPQGKYKKALTKKAQKGSKGTAAATIAFYGPDNTRAAKVVCAIVSNDCANATPHQPPLTRALGL